MDNSGFRMQPPSSGKHEIICEPSSSKHRKVKANKDNTTTSKMVSATKLPRKGGQGEEKNAKKRKKVEMLEEQKNVQCERKNESESKMKENTGEEGNKKKKKDKGVGHEQQNEKGASESDKVEVRDNSASDKKESGSLKKAEKGAPSERKINTEKKKEKRKVEVNTDQSPTVEPLSQKGIDINLVKELVSDMINEGNQKFKEESRNMVEGHKNELAAANEKQREYIKSMATDSKKNVFDMATNGSPFLTTEMIESGLPELNDSEKKEVEEKWRQQKIIEVEAGIKRYALMQEEIQMRLLQARTILNEGNF